MLVDSRFLAHAAVNMASFSTAVPLPGGCLSRLHIDTLLAATIFVVVAALSLLPQQEPRFLPPLPVPSFALLFTPPRASCIRMRSGVYAQC